MEDPNDDSSKKIADKKRNMEIEDENISDSVHKEIENEGYVSESLARNNVDSESVHIMKDGSNSNSKDSRGDPSNALSKDIETNRNEVDFKSFYIQKDSRTPYSDATNSLHDPGKIKRPMNPFMIFSHYERKKILEAQSDLHNAHISKILGQKWKELSTEAKLPFKQEAERLRQFHLIEFPDYRYHPRKRIKKDSFLSFISATNLSPQSQPKMAKTEKCSFKISNNFGSNSWVNSPVSDLRIGSTQPINPVELGLNVTIDTSFKDILRNSHQNKAKETSPMNNFSSPTSSYYSPGISSNLLSSPNMSRTPSFYQVNNSSSFNPPSTPPDFTQLHQQQFDHQWYEKEWIHHCQQQHEGHQLWDQQQWYLQEFPNLRNTHVQLVTETSRLEDGQPISSCSFTATSNCASIVEVDTLPLMTEVVQIVNLPRMKEDINVDLASSPAVSTEVHMHSNEITRFVASFEDNPNNFQKFQKRNECKKDCEAVKEIVPELSKFAKVIPLNILKEGNEDILHEKEKTDCDLVVGDRVVDVDSEWRTFSSESGGEDKARVGGFDNSLLSKSNPSTMTNPVTFDGCSKPLDNNMRIISRMGEKMNVTKTITDRANKLFNIVRDGKKMKGRSSDSIAAACLYIACRQEGMPRTFKEIVTVSTVSKKEIIKCYKLILKVHDTHVDLITTGDFMSRFCETLSLNGDVQKAADFIAKKAKDLDIVLGRSPRSVAAASIYMASQASGDKRTLCEIADIARVNYTTIRQCYKLMLPRASEIFPSDFKFDRCIEYLPLK